MFAVILEAPAGALRPGHFLDLHLIVFVKKRPNFNIRSYYFKYKSTKSLSFKKVSDVQSDIQIIMLSQKKIGVILSKTLKLKFILMFFNSVFPTRPSDTVTEYAIYPLSYW